MRLDTLEATCGAAENDHGIADKPMLMQALAAYSWREATGRGLLVPTMSHSDWFLETERLVLRRITLGDTGLMLAIWNDPAFIHHVGDRGIRTIEDAQDALNKGAFKLYEEHGYGPYCMSLKRDGTQIGICGLFRRDNLDDPDIGFAVLPGYRGKGFVAEAAHAVVTHARDDLGIMTLTAIVSPNNTASIGLIEKLGLKFERGITMPGEDDEISLYSMKLG